MQVMMEHGEKGKRSGFMELGDEHYGNAQSFNIKLSENKDFIIYKPFWHGLCHLSGISSTWRIAG